MQAPATFRFQGFDIPLDLMRLTGGGPETFEGISRAHIENLQRHVGLSPDFSILEIGCGIGRDAIPLTRILSPRGSYVGVDIVGASIRWCTESISRSFPNFTFLHFDVADQLHNPSGTISTRDIRLPLADHSVDRIILQSVFTHLLRDDIVHYLREFRRVLKPSGLAYATLFVYNDEILARARATNRTPFDLRFEHEISPGCRINDRTHPLGAVAYTAAVVDSMIAEGGLRLARPLLKGGWSGYYQNPDDGQDVAILTNQPARRAKLLAGIDPETLSGLELGPLDRPIVDRRQGYRVKYLDHNSTEALRKRFKADPNVDTAALAEIDFVIEGGNLLEVVRERFDYIVASHVFEHVPNPILWLQEMATLLNPGGLLCLAIPDRRYTFDLIRPATSIGEMMQAFFTGRTRPAFKNVFDQNYYWRNVGPGEAWAGTPDPRTMQPPQDKAVALSYARLAIDTDKYLDVHCNLMSSTEFVFFFDALRTYDLTALQVANLYPCERNDLEFIVQLRKPASPA